MVDIRFMVGVLSLSTLLFIGCLGDEPEERDFFQVTTLAARTDLDTFGTIRLNGDIDALASDGMVIDHGFYFSNDLTLIDCIDGEGFAVQSLGAREGGGAFSQKLTGLEEGTYYFRSYAKVGERLVCGQEDSIRLGLDFEITQLDPIRRNDSITYLLEVSSSISLDNFEVGYHLLQQNGTDFDTIRSNVSLGNETETVFTLFFPEFNTRYRLVPYFIGSRNYSGEPLEILVTDGWRRISDFPQSLTETTVVTFNNDILVFGGCRTINCGGGNTAQSVYRLNDPGSTPPEFWQWEDLSNAFTNTPLLNAHEGIGFTFLEEIYLGFGFSEANNYGGISKIDGIDLSSEFCNSTISTMVNGVAFTVDNVAYFGLGRKESNQLSSDFYSRNLFLDTAFVAFSPDTIASPPHRDGGVDIPRSREKAVVVRYGPESESKWLLGTGRSAPTHMKDFYEFTPPNEEFPDGSWEYAGSMGQFGRYEANAFTIGERAFVGFGIDIFGRYYEDLWEYKTDNPIEQRWVQRQSLPALGRAAATSFGTDEVGCLCGGTIRNDVTGNDTKAVFGDCYVYYPSQFD